MGLEIDKTYEVTGHDLYILTTNVAGLAIRDTLEFVIKKLSKELNMNEVEIITLIMGRNRLENILNIYNHVQNQN